MPLPLVDGAWNADPARGQEVEGTGEEKERAVLIPSAASGHTGGGGCRLLKEVVGISVA